MNKAFSYFCLFAWCLSIGIVGCGDSAAKSVKLAPAGGTVTYKGAPLAGARVTFMPEKGPLAMAETDLNGAFKLKTGALDGCAVGNAQVSISIPSEEQAASTTVLNPNPKTEEERSENSRKMAEMTMAAQKPQASKPKSMIPERYKEPATSGLSYKIEPAGSKDLKIELKD